MGFHIISCISFLFYQIPHLTNYCGLSGLKLYLSLVHSLHRSSIWVQMSWILRSRCHQAEIKVSAEPAISSQLQGLF